MPDLPRRAAEIDDWLQRAMRRHGLVGVQLSLRRGGGEALDLGAGLANAERGLQMTPGTLVAVGSVTKVLNAALVVGLAHEGRLDLDTPIVRCAPGLHLAEDAQERITLRQLLSMSAGLDNGPYAVRGTGDDGLDAYVRSVGDIPHPYPPGQGFGYSNLGSCLAGWVAQQAAGVRWAELLQRLVLTPCGLDEVALGADALPFHAVAVGHVAGIDAAPPSVLRPWGHSHAQAPAGSSLAMSVRRLADFGAALVGVGLRGAAGLPTEVVHTMLTPTARVTAPLPSMGIGDAWGLGPSRAEWGGQAVWCHAGGMRSARSFLACLPASAGVLAVATNTPAPFMPFLAQLFEELVPEVFDVAPPRPMRSAGCVLDPVALRRVAGRYERFGVQIDITADVGLHCVETHLGSGAPGETQGVVLSTACRAIAPDRFEFDMPGFVEPLPLVFSGSDAAGHATLVTSSLFPARRAAH